MPSYTRASPDAKPVRAHGTVMGLPPAQPSISQPTSAKPQEVIKPLPKAEPQPSAPTETSKEGA